MLSLREHLRSRKRSTRTSWRSLPTSRSSPGSASSSSRSPSRDRRVEFDHEPSLGRGRFLAGDPASAALCRRFEALDSNVGAFATTAEVPAPVALTESPSPVSSRPSISPVVAVALHPRAIHRGSETEFCPTDVCERVEIPAASASPPPCSAPGCASAPCSAVLCPPSGLLAVLCPPSGLLALAPLIVRPKLLDIVIMRVQIIVAF